MSAAAKTWTPRWTRCAEPQGVRWDPLRRDQGQTVEVSYADPYPSAEAGPSSHPALCSPYKRVLDRSTGETTYYRLANGETL